MSKDAFEAYKRSGPLIGYTESVKDGILKKNGSGYYISDAVQSAWLAWQAAESHTARECFNIVHAERLENPTKEQDDVGYELALDDAENAIRAAYPDAFKEEE